MISHNRVRLSLFPKVILHVSSIRHPLMGIYMYFQFLKNAHLEAVQCRLKLVPIVVPLAMDVGARHQLGTTQGETRGRQ